MDTNSIITIYLRSTIARARKGYFKEVFEASATIDNVFVWGSKAHFDAVRKPFSVVLTCSVSDRDSWNAFKAKYQTKGGLWKRTNAAKAIRLAVEGVEDTLGWRDPAAAEVAKANAFLALQRAGDDYKAIAEVEGVIYGPYRFDDSRPGAKEAKKAWLKAKKDFAKAMSL